MSEQGPRLLVNAEVRLVPQDQPWLRADDAGVLRGDGLFESLLAADGEPQLLEEHLARMARSAKMMDLPRTHRTGPPHPRSAQTVVRLTSATSSAARPGTS